MRKTVINNIVLVFLILVLGLTSSICSLSKQHESYNYRELWNSWTDNHRNIYLWGLRDGLLEQPTANPLSLLVNYEIYDNYIKRGKPIVLYIDSYLHEYSKEIREVIKKERAKAWDTIIAFGSPKIPLETIRDVMTDLYKDPANSFISLSDMSFLAFWKLKGESVETVLIVLRKKALGGIE